MADDPPKSAAVTVSQPRWSGRSRGGYLGNWLLVQIIRFLGIRIAYVWAIFVAAYFTVAAPKSYRCSLDFLQRVLGPQPFWKRPVLVFRHFLSLGITLLDRIAAIMGRGRLECRFEGESLFREYCQRGQGVILLGAHVGNWDLGGQLLSRVGTPVNVVVLERESEAIRQLFDRALQTRTFRLLTTDGHPLRSVPILAALRRGEIVALHGDRAFGGADLPIPFLGGVARFPIGPYLLAAVSGAPIFQVFVVRESIGHYRLFAVPAKVVPRDLARSKPEALEPHVMEYAERLAETARSYPFQWYNLYPFWEDSEAGAAAEKG